MAEITSRFQPSFSIFPINNNRTGYQPINMPLVLVVPYRRTASGQPVGDTNVFNVRFYIEEAPGRAKVAGFRNRGILVPNLERFRLDIDSGQLADVKHDPTGDFFYDQDSLESIDFSEARTGDFFEFGLMRGPLGAFGQSGPGAIDRLPYYPDADYYDLSPFIIEVFDLPVGRYRVVWEASYYERVLSASGEVICLDTTKIAKTRFSMMINHPGEIHEAMRKYTPELYFSGSRTDRDPTIAFYRPLADALQDIFDEQELIKGINWVDKIPTQYIPYLAFLLGLDLPYFPSSTDDIRRSLLRNGRRLQQFKGSQRAIRELFEIFGFTIDLTNLWYSQDGQRFIAPNEQLPEEYADQEITTEDVCHSEPLLNAYNTSGFGQVEIPLLFRPTGNLTIDAFLVEEGSESELQLRSLVEQSANDLEALEADNCGLTVEGFQSNTAFQVTGPIVGWSRVLLSQRKGSIAEQQSGSEPIINQKTTEYDFNRNSVNITFDHYLDFGGRYSNRKVYVFATYERRKIILPPALADLRSNRFDIGVLTFKDGEQPSSDIFEFLIDFLFKFKAFHSLLRKITYAVEIDEIYNVQDFCLGGEFGEAPNQDLGNLQTIPAIAPIEPTEGVCQNVPESRGYKEEDFRLRNRIRDKLEEEHEAWKNLDGTHQVSPSLLPILQSLSRLEIRTPEESPCEFTQYGQDRVIAQDADYDHVEDDREKICDLENNTSDYCYKGRVGQEIISDRVLTLDEISRCKPCNLDGGLGSYYLTNLVPNSEFSGGDLGTDAPNFTEVSNLRRSRHDANFVRIMAFPQAEIHYTDRHYLDCLEDQVNNRYFSGRKPSLDIQKDNLFIPGHRFITMINLEEDYVSSEYDFRPWDDAFHLCPGTVPVPELNERLVTDTDGNQRIVFDLYSWTAYGNGIPADIPQMDDHTASAIDPNFITHSIWSSTGPGLCWSTGSQYGSNVQCVIDQWNDVEEMGVRYPLEAIGEEVDTICFSDVLGPIFESANRNCECPGDGWVAESLDNYVNRSPNLTDGYINPSNLTGQPALTAGADYLDGYPAAFGAFITNLSDYDFDRGTTDSGGYATAIGIPSTLDGNVTLQFTLGSGIKVLESDPQYRHYKPYRLDCGCGQYGCEEVTGATDITATPQTLAPVMRCPEDLFFNNGVYDFNCDQLEIGLTMSLNEFYGSKSCLLDGSIPNMFSFDETKFTSNGIEDFPSEGDFQFVDDYGVQYFGMFETFGDRIDITIVTKDPRVPGQEASGEVINRKVFRDGIITMDRQILQDMDSGYMIIAEGCEQQISRFQTTFGCGDDQVFEDPFAYHLDFNIIDDLEMIVTRVNPTGTG